MVGYVLKVYGEFGRHLVREWIFIMTKGHGLSRGVLKIDLFEKDSFLFVKRALRPLLL